MLEERERGGNDVIFQLKLLKRVNQPQIALSPASLPLLIILQHCLISVSPWSLLHPTALFLESQLYMLLALGCLAHLPLEGASLSQDSIFF